MVSQKYRWDFIGLSTDEKPTSETSEKVVNGSTYYCSDTSKLYVYCDGTWYERKPLGGGGGSYVAGNGIDITDDTISVDTTTIQPKLTAGSNVTISDDTISATDTTYSNFVGTDGTTAGTAGLVPAPAITDAGKFLKADGTWDTAGGGSSYTAGDGIDITNDIISATNTGKAKVLATADYNYPTDNPSFVAAYKLEPGFYYADSGVSVKADKNAVKTIRGGFFVGYENGTVQIVNPGINSASLSVFLVSRAYGYLTNSVDLYGPVDNLTSTDTDKPLSANQGRVLKELIDSIAIRGAGAPTTATVGRLGQIYIDTTNADAYMCVAVDTVTPSYTWKKITA